MTTLRRPWAPGDPVPAGTLVLGGIDPVALGTAAGEQARAGFPPSPVRARSMYQRGYIDRGLRAAAQLVPLISNCLAQLHACRHVRNRVSREDPLHRMYDLLADAYRGELKRLLTLRRLFLEDPYR